SEERSREDPGRWGEEPAMEDQTAQRDRIRPGHHAGRDVSRGHRVLRAVPAYGGASPRDGPRLRPGPDKLQARQSEILRGPHGARSSRTSPCRRVSPVASKNSRMGSAYFRLVPRASLKPDTVNPGGAPWA